MSIASWILYIQITQSVPSFDMSINTYKNQYVMSWGAGYGVGALIETKCFTLISVAAKKRKFRPLYPLRRKKLEL